MLTRRNWLLRFSIVLNVVVLCYVAIHFVSYNGGVELVMPAAYSGIETTRGRNSAVIQYNAADLKTQTSLDQIQSRKFFSVFSSPGRRTDNSSERVHEGQKEAQDKSPVYDDQTYGPSNRTSDFRDSSEASGKNGDSVVMSIPLRTHLPKAVVASTTQAALNASTALAEGAEKSLEEVIKCHDREQKYRSAQRGDFWVLYNYVRSRRTFRCHESVTYTTHADFTFLDNLGPLLERWQGPVSLALHAPGTDFDATLQTIQYLRECGSPLVAELVTFHVYFGTRFVPRKIVKPSEVEKIRVNCSLPAPWFNVTSKKLFKTQRKILYPINVGRNVARESAVTHYVLPSDIELYPSPGVLRDFLEMVRRQDAPLRRPNPKVFPLPIFELEANATVPSNKTQLVQMLKERKAIPFHKKLCSGCHNIPRAKEWVQERETEGVHVFHIGKRLGNFIHWEPIFIGTHEDPLYDERLSWEGKSDKMTQGYALCVLDYDFLILDNAFLVHKPGIKALKKDPERSLLASKTNSLIKKKILPELQVIYGTRKGCVV